jgi:hypothetical protein
VYITSLCSPRSVPTSQQLCHQAGYVEQVKPSRLYQACNPVPGVLLLRQPYYSILPTEPELGLHRNLELQKHCISGRHSKGCNR